MQASEAGSDRRQHPRFPLATNMEFYHPASRREFPGRSVDVSRGGLLMYIPATVPVQPGQTVRLDTSALARHEQFPAGEHALQATIVRVDRQPLLSGGHIAVGMRFQPGQA